MPLPKPPAKRASLLSVTDFESQAAPKPAKRSPRTSAAAEPASPAELNLYKPEALAPTAPTRLPARAPAEAPAGSVAPAALKRQEPKPRAIKPRGTGPAKLFVLDTNVLMHDPMSLFRFEEHDIFLPMIVLEELDGHKKGMTEVARNARQASRTLDALAGAQGADIGAGLKLSTTGHREAGGCLFFQTQALANHLPPSLPQGKADNQILGGVHALRELHSP
ncbi:MAG: PIN domain-containing protein, partial [Pseudomonadota bacterium]|nr:PIN domain-containing protein [Pseudomonadota bacterium]